MTVTDREMVGLIVRVSTALLAVTSLVAVMTWTAFAAPARDFLGFTFDGVPSTASAAWSIFKHNSALMLAVFLCALIANAPWSMAPDPKQLADARSWRCTRRFADGLLAGVTAVNCAVVGVAVGAYGQRMVVALLPHGPFELLAFSTALTLYLLARRGPVSRRVLITLLTSSIAALAIAASTEALVTA